MASNKDLYKEFDVKLVTKKCSHCGEAKLHSEFYKDKSKVSGLSSSCKMCSNERVKLWKANNPEKVREKNKIYDRKYRETHAEELKAYRKKYYNDNREYFLVEKKEYRKQYYEKNKEEVLRRQREYYHAHKEEIKERRKDYFKRYAQEHREERNAYNRQWQKKNKEKIKERRYKEGVRYRAKHKDAIRERKQAYENKRRKCDPMFRLKGQVRIMVRDSFRRKGLKKSDSTEKILGCSLLVFQEHLLQTWEKRYGVAWNGEDCHIDHIIPLATAETEEDIIRLCHYTNLQLLTPADNFEKGGTI